ncbi:MAG: DUF3769 domain-containing protein [Okeania sp. SIO2C9]|uniref:DUF3769 domain-containing protein n=1 Tax=Okeania sp. SIO2C9 TaxID=2607791 RepID=UPI0013C1DDD7|nr:DUF3769 domain-containing protein [Okeania sp. SIO2C9]NEQ74152.1 DUF3769 domain-containing protein [Okeania sp. SIO2C9]
MSYPLPPPELPPIVETLPSQTVTQSVIQSRQEVYSPVPKSNQGTEEIILSVKSTFSGQEFRQTVLYKIPKIKSTFDPVSLVSPIHTTSASLGPPVEIDISSAEKISTIENQINLDRKLTFSSTSFSNFSEYTTRKQEEQTSKQANLYNPNSREILQSFSENTASTRKKITTSEFFSQPEQLETQTQKQTLKIGQTIEDSSPELPNLPQEQQPIDQPDVPESKEEETPIPIADPESQTQESNEETENKQPITVPLPADVVEVTAERQEYDDQRRLITAEGKVIVRFSQGLVNADKVQINLTTRQLLATGNAVFTQGQQVLLGERMEYNFTLDKGVIEQASGIIFVGNAEEISSSSLPTTEGVGALQATSLSDRISATQPPTNVKATEGTKVTFEPKLEAPEQAGTVNRLRFEADRLNLLGAGTWEATNLRLTNDPFSPPEVELRSERATLKPLSPFQDELITKKARLVFDNRFSLPLFRERTIIDRNQRDPLPIQIGYDQDDRGGLFVETTFEPPLQIPFQVRLTPQYYLERAFLGDEGDSPIDDNVFGLKASINGSITPTTQLEGRATFLTFKDFPDLEEDDFRGSIRLRQLYQGYNLTGEYSYRDRLFNGSLGFQTVHSSAGVVLTSPLIPVGETGAQLSFQTGYQTVNARTDRRELLTDLQPFEPLPDENDENDDDDAKARADLGRFQSVVSLRYPLTIWSGEALPATPTEGLRYTSKPVVPFVQMVLGLTGATSLYSNDDDQSYLRGSLGFTGQFGHFSRDFFDYTGFNLTYSQTGLSGQSPFFFDRVEDTNVLLFGLVQQIYKGFRVGYQSGINIENGDILDDRITLEYSRRTYGVVLTFSPRRQTGTFSLRISDFNWQGGTTPFSGEDIRPVGGGVVR